MKATNYFKNIVFFCVKLSTHLIGKTEHTFKASDRQGTFCTLCCPLAGGDADKIMLAKYLPNTLSLAVTWFVIADMKSIK